MPTRLLNWCSQQGLHSLRDLVQHTSFDLVEIHGLGERTMRDFALAIEAETGLTLSQLIRKEEGRSNSGGHDAADLTSLQVKPHVDWRYVHVSTIPLMPVRIQHWCHAQGIEYLGELIQWTEPELLRERNLGRKTIQQYVNAVRVFTQHTPAELRQLIRAAVVGSGQGDGAAPRLPTNWGELDEVLSESVRSVPIKYLDLPTRMLNYCEREGIATVGDLILRSYDVLINTKNLGRKTIRDSFRIIVAYHRETEMGQGGESAERDDNAFASFKDHADLAEMIRYELKRLDTLERLILTRRIGILQPSETLSFIGEILNVTRERVRQIQENAIQKLLQKRPQFEELTLALSELCGEGLYAASDLYNDPFFRPLAENPKESKFFLERFTRRRIRFVILEGESFLTNLGVDIESAFRNYRDAAAESTYPLSEQSLRVSLAAKLPPELKVTEPVFWELLTGFLSFTGGADEREVLAYGSSRNSNIMAFVRDSRGPVSVQEIKRRFGRGSLPPELMYARRGYVVDPQFLPGFERWKGRMIRLCVRRMREQGPERQWTTFELHDVLSEEAQLPAWSTPWTLSGMCKLEPSLKYLGRGRVVLAEVDGFEKRLHIRDVLHRQLESAGSWLTEEDLQERVRTEIGALRSDFRMYLSSSPAIVQWRDRQWGLVARDLPGGERAFEEAAALLENALEERTHGMTARELGAFAQGLGAPYCDWPIETLQSVARASPALRLSQGGSIGLRNWPDELIPSRKSVIVDVIERNGGRVSSDEVKRELEQRFGADMPLSQVAFIARSAGYALSDHTFVRLEGSENASSDAAGLPVNIPHEAQAMFNRFLESAEVPIEDLLEQVRSHADVLIRAHQDNGLIDLEDVEAAVGACERILMRAVSSSDAEAIRYASAAARYFVASDDAESDFAVGGLDDDLAVLDAVAAYLSEREQMRTVECGSG